MRKQKSSVAFGVIVIIVFVLNGLVSIFIEQTPTWVVWFVGAICITLYTFEQYKKFIKLKQIKNNKPN